MSIFEKLRPTKLLDRFTPESAKSGRDTLTALQAKGYSKVGTSGRKGSSAGRAFDVLTMGSLREKNLNRSWGVAIDPSPGSAERATRGYGQAFSETHRSANLGHQAINEFRNQEEGEVPPNVPELPAQGAGVASAKAQARQRALDAARKRFGLAATVGTTPLGLQGEGAPLGKKTLIGA